MKGRIIYNRFLLPGILCGSLLCSGLAGVSNLSGNVMNTVYAEEKKDDVIQYSYDSLGRVVSVIYPDKTKITYTYDKNGNILSCKTEKNNDGSGGGGTTEHHGSSRGTTTGQSNSSGGQTTTEKTEVQNKPTVSTSVHYTATEIKKYNQFKKRKGKIKSLKVVKKKKKYYLKITVNKIFSSGTYGEKGYQIKYATNKRFKKAKTIKLKRTKKSLNSKSWKVKKGKTYYVKVRGYMKTRTGKTIYTKYSAVKKIKVK